MAASGGNHLECVKFLLKYSADVEYKTKDGLSALQSAVVNGALDCVKIILVQTQSHKGRRIDVAISPGGG